MKKKKTRQQELQQKKVDRGEGNESILQHQKKKMLAKSKHISQLGSNMYHTNAFILPTLNAIEK